MATLKDIAEHVGISVTAASLALRDHQSISMDTKQRVWNAQELLGYHRHVKPKRLKSGSKKGGGRTRNIAFLLISRQFQDAAYAEAFQAIADAASDHALLPVYLSAKAEEIKGGKLPLPLRDREVDGIIVSGVYDEAAHKQLKRLNLPIVVMGNYDLGSEAWSACEIDSRAGVRLAIERLTALGHRRMGLLDCSLALAAHQENQRTYLESVTKNNAIDAGQATIDDDGCIRNSLYSLLAKPDRPTALIVSLAAKALDAYDICHELGLSIPGDISIISYGDEKTVLHPSVTSINVNHAQIARGALTKLTQLIENPDHPITREIFGIELKPGGSMGKCPVEQGLPTTQAPSRRKSAGKVTLPAA